MKAEVKVKGEGPCHGTRDGGWKIGDSDSRYSRFKRRQRIEDWRFEISRFKKRSHMGDIVGQGRFRGVEIIRPEAWSRCPGEQVQTKPKPSPNKGARAKTKPSEAMGINHFIVNGIRLKPQKQSHGDHRPWLQSFTAILTRFSGKLLPMARRSVLPIQGTGTEGKLSGDPTSGSEDLFGYRYGKT